MSRKSAYLIATLNIFCSLANAQPTLTDEQRLGKRLYSDVNLSANKNQSCATCHSLAGADDKTPPAFVDPVNLSQGTPVSLGSIPYATGTLNAPSAAYAAFSPPFHWNASEAVYEGGQFWNGRASTLEDQAQMPFLNPVEMAMPNEWAVVSRLKEDADYVRRFYKIYRLDLDAVPHIKDALFVQQTPQAVHEIFLKLAQAIAAFEKSPVFSKFNSKYDFVLAGQTKLTDQEQRGLTLFNGKAGCAACHISTATAGANGVYLPPMFTDFTYDNIGLPRNVAIPGNPAPNQGLGGRADIKKQDVDRAELGKHKVMTLRNIAITPPYGHNGVLATLEQVVHFYNTRDTLGAVPDNRSADFGITGWSKPEVDKNVNHDELGDLGLNPAQEQAVVAFLKTLTDDYPEWGNDPLVPPGTPSPFADVVAP